MNFEIKSRWSGSILFSIDTESLRSALEAAVMAKANLRMANLGGANLGWADLTPIRDLAGGMDGEAMPAL